MRHYQFSDCCGNRFQTFPTQQFHRLIYMTPVWNEKLFSRPICCCTTHNKVILFQAGAFVLSFLTKVSETIKNEPRWDFFPWKWSNLNRFQKYFHNFSWKKKFIPSPIFCVRPPMPTPVCPHVEWAAELWLMNLHCMGRTAGIGQFRCDCWFFFFWPLCG